MSKNPLTVSISKFTSLEQLYIHFIICNSSRIQVIVINQSNRSTRSRDDFHRSSYPILILFNAQLAGNTGKCMKVACKGSRDLTKAQRVISTHIYLQIYIYIYIYFFFISGSFVHIIRKITD